MNPTARAAARAAVYLAYIITGGVASGFLIPWLWSTNVGKPELILFLAVLYAAHVWTAIRLIRWVEAPLTDRRPA